jgi:CPA1 family monovalent cation:H+ antiporter
MGWSRLAKERCPHRAALDERTTSTADRCAVCGLAEDLRLCLTCGYVSCCESHGAHDTDHWKETGHPFIRPHLVKGAHWTWCYACNAFLD